MDYKNKYDEIMSVLAIQKDSDILSTLTKNCFMYDTKINDYVLDTDFLSYCKHHGIHFIHTCLNRPDQKTTIFGLEYGNDKVYAIQSPNAAF